MFTEPEWLLEKRTSDAKAYWAFHRSVNGGFKLVPEKETTEAPEVHPTNPGKRIRLLDKSAALVASGNLP